MKKLGIIVGHTAKASGAVNYKGESEYYWNARIAYKMKKIILEKYIGVTPRVFARDVGGMSGVADEMVKDFLPDLSIELHFNAYHKPAYGCEILVYKDSMFEETAEIADKILRIRHPITYELFVLIHL